MYVVLELSVWAGTGVNVGRKTEHMLFFYLRQVSVVVLRHSFLAFSVPDAIMSALVSELFVFSSSDFPPPSVSLSFHRRHPPAQEKIDKEQ